MARFDRSNELGRLLKGNFTGLERRSLSNLVAFGTNVGVGFLSGSSLALEQVIAKDFRTAH